jgi:hypothetical protein
MYWVCVCTCVAVDEEPEQEDVLAEDTSGSEARNETGTHASSRTVSRTIGKLIYIFHTMADEDIEREADLLEEQIVS